MEESDRRILQAIQGSFDPDAEPIRFPSPSDSPVYGSDQEDEENDLLDNENSSFEPDIHRITNEQQFQNTSNPNAAATGPKGVLSDYRHHQHREKEKQSQRDKTFQKELNSKALSSGWLQRQLLLEINEKNNENNPLEDTQDDIDFMTQYKLRRLAELKKEYSRPSFGNLESISVEEYVDCIEKENSSITILIHLFEPRIQQSRSLQEVLENLAQKYGFIKFKSMLARDAEPNFDLNVLPAILVYRGGHLVGNFVGLLEYLSQSKRGGRIIQEELEDFLIKEKIFTENDLTGSTKGMVGSYHQNRRSHDNDNESEDDDDDF